MKSSLGFLLLASDLAWALPVGIVVGALVGSLVFFLVKRVLDKSKRAKVDSEIEAQKERAKAEIEEDRRRALAEARKEAIIEAKEQELKARNDLDREIREKRAEIQKMEQRLVQKEDALDRKEEGIDKKNALADQQLKELEEKQESVRRLQDKVANQHELMVAEIEKVAQLTREEAKKQLMEAIEDDARREVAGLVRNIEQTAKDEAEKKAKNIISLAIQKCAAEHTSETTVSVVPLPNDDMKARIIGREGRNIRALENATGMELIIDDTPEVITISGFDPVRREVARITLERLIADGRIHPARIEETVEKVRKELDQQIKETGESAMFEVGIYGLHPELVKLLGRMKYRTSYGQNVLRHSIEVAQLAGSMAAELGCDVALAKRAGLLHDIGKSVDHEMEGTHIQIGADLAKKYKENANVVNAIMAHHGDVEAKTIEAVLVAAADAISGARPGARRETNTNYVKRLQKLEEIGSGFDGVDKCYAIQAGREIRVIVKPDRVDDAQTLFLAKDIAKKIEAELEYPGQIKVNVIREQRAVEYAK